MAIVGTDIDWYLSVKTGSAGNSTGSTPAGSLGKYISTSQITSGGANNIFDDVSGDENAASDVEYRCTFIRNAHGSLDLQAPVIWIQSEQAGGASMAFAIDDIAASPIGQAGAQADEVADEDTAPTGIGSWSTATSKATGLSLCPTDTDLAFGECKAVWWRRTAADSVAVDNDDALLRCEGDTAA